MAFGYETFLNIGSGFIGVKACSYSFEKDIDENGSVVSTLKGGLIHLSLEDIPDNDVISWALEHRKRKSGIITTVSISDRIPIADEEIYFENGVCTGFKIMFERDGMGYFTTLLTISADNISIGRGENLIERRWIQ